MSFPSINQQLYKDKKFSDVIFKFGKEEIHGHRNILCLSCPYFDKMLNGAFSEARCKIIELKETPLKHFEQIIRYCYLQKLDIKGWGLMDVLELLTLAHEYQYDALIYFLSDVLENQYLKTTVLDTVFSFASKLAIPDLELRCVNYANRNLTAVLKGKTFQSYSIDLVLAILDKCFLTDNEYNEFLVALADWRNNHTSDEALKVLKKISWGRISPQLLQVFVQQAFEVDDFFDDSFWVSLKCVRVANVRPPSPLILKRKIIHLESDFESDEDTETDTDSDFLPNGPIDLRD